MGFQCGGDLFCNGNVFVRGNVDYFITHHLGLFVDQFKAKLYF